MAPSGAAVEQQRPSMVKGASLLILLQLLSRLVTFLANQLLLLRLLTAPLLGVAAQLDVYYLSVLFFAREALRVAVQRTAPSARRRDARHDQAVVNIGYLAVALGAFLAVAFGWLYLASAGGSTLHAAPLVVPSLFLYGVAAVLELLSEPCFVLMQTRLRFGTRATAESAATFLRCIVAFGFAFWASRRHLDIGVLPFAMGQLSYAISLLAIYLVSGHGLASSSGFSLFPRAVSASGDADFLLSYFYRPTISLAGSMMAQSVVKHLLTQGDTFLVSLLSTPEVQGVYALANNYGGLLARLLFQPVEESSRSYFSRLLSSPALRMPLPSDHKPSTEPAPAVQEAKQSLDTLLRLYILLSVVVVSIGPFAAPALLAIVAGSRWTGVGAGHVLGAYCFYIPFLALNGLTESFVASVASEAQVHRQSVWMGAFSVAFAASAFVFMRVFPLGAQGLVLANIINMLCRIVWSVVFIKTFFKQHRAHFSIASLVPGTTLATSLSTFVLLRQLNVYDKAESEPIMTLAKIAGSAIPLVFTMFVSRDVPDTPPCAPKI